MSEMSKTEIRRLLNKDTFTGKLATVKKDGSSHVVPIWFVLDYRNNEVNLGNIYFTTFSGSVKAENIQRDNRISICIDDQTPPFSFVTIHGTAKLYPYKQKEVLKWATRIAKRYMGKKDSKAYGERNSGEDAILVRIKPTKIIAEKDIATWD
ncbi:MAG: PPOX class F420-dependent oxidoreductase [Thaumarchaeota archaeon]|nr:MAG: PPOX class F420-dependent oxidoreductase [Nitrososphaerota archaeon]TLX87560.1 MAG: PPOX class F420-dependent oxidoreductase [Nitrososphaerota archaeon]TLX92215.1 MAG: PPOX class F420-dependent oxidoreductase [Nitrososphaerota archaeon]